MQAGSGANYLIIDQGGHSSRAVVVDGMGRTLAAHRVPVRIQEPGSGYAEYPARALLESVLEAIHAVLDAVPPAQSPMLAGLAVQRSSVVCWDPVSGEPLSPVIAWQDRRAAEELAAAGVAPELVQARTGLRLSPHYGAAKLRWCTQHLPAVAQAARDGRLACGPLAAWLVYHLCEQRPLLIEPGLACRMLLADYRRQMWDPELLDAFGLQASWLPTIRPNTFEYGTVSAGEASLPLGLLMGDQSAALFCQGLPRQNRLYINAGSGAFLQRVVGSQPEPVRGLLVGPVYSDGTKRIYALEATVNGAANAFDWVDSHLNASLDWQRWLHESPLSDNPMLFLNGVGGLGSPWWRPDFAPAFRGQGRDRERAQAVIESILFLIRRNIDWMNQACDTPLEDILIGGGLSQSDWFCQWLADLSGMPVSRPGDPEMTLRGMFHLLRGADTPPPRDPALQSFTAQADNPVNARYLDWLRLMPDI